MTDSLTNRQKLALGLGVIDPPSSMAMNDTEFDVLFMLRKRIPTKNIRASRLFPIDLQRRGLKSSLGLRELGFDCVDLTDSAFCASAVAAFGVDEVSRSFVLDGSDAVVVAGSTAVFQLDLKIDHLLSLCAGSSTQAAAVIMQTEPRGGCLNGVTAQILLDTGLRAGALCKLGFHENSIRSQTGANSNELQSLGFTT